MSDVRYIRTDSQVFGTSEASWSHKGAMRGFISHMNLDSKKMKKDLKSLTR